MTKKVVMLIISLFFISSFSFAQDSLLEIKLTDTYSKYGVSFKYPSGMKLSEEGFPMGIPTEHKGLISGEIYPGEDCHLLRISWLELASEEGKGKEFLETGLGAGYELIKGLVNGSTNFIKKDKIEIIINGHKLLYQFYEGQVKDLSVYGILGSWYCDKSKRAFTLNVGYNKREEVLPLFERYTASFTCHTEKVKLKYYLYRDPINDFYINLPSDWGQYQEHETSGGKIIRLMPLHWKVSPRNLPPTFTIASEKDTLITNAKGNAIEYVRTIFRGFVYKEMSSKILTYSPGIDAYEIIYTLSDSHKSKYKCRMMTIVKGKYLYRLTYSAPLDIYPEYEATIGHCIETFTIE